MWQQPRTPLGQPSLSQLQVLGLFPESRPVRRRDAPTPKGGRNNSPYRDGSLSALFGQRSGCWALQALAPVYLKGPGRDCEEINKDIKFRKLFNKAAFPTRCPGKWHVTHALPGPRRKVVTVGESLGLGIPLVKGGGGIARESGSLYWHRKSPYRSALSSPVLCDAHPRRPRDLLGRGMDVLGREIKTP